jgi:hypothetical protein
MIVEIENNLRVILKQYNFVCESKIDPKSIFVKKIIYEDNTFSFKFKWLFSPDLLI